MRKLTSILVLAGLFLASCQKDQQVAQTSDSAVKVAFTASLPSGVAFSRGASDQGGTVANVNYAAYDLRYLLEVYNTDGVLVYRDMQVADTPAAVTFSTTLVPAQYNFVFWADIVTQGSTADLHYNTANLKAVSIITSSAWSANDDTRDAYTTFQSINLTSALSQNITLTRPFGKVRVIAQDVNGSVINKPEWANIVYNNPLPTGYDASTGMPLVVAPAVAYSAAQLVNDDRGLGTVQTLAWDYIFAPASGQAGYGLDISVYDATSTLIKTRTLPQVPIQRNMLTTVRGNFFTVSTSFMVNVAPAFGSQTDIDPTQFAIGDVQAYLDYMNTTSSTDPIEINVIGAVNASQSIVIPALSSIPSVSINFTTGIDAGATISISGSYAGAANFSLPSAAGMLNVDLPSATTNFAGSIAAYAPNLVISPASSVYWWVGTTADAKAALNQTAAPFHGLQPYNKGMYITADINDFSSDDTGNPASGNVSNQQSLSIGDFSFDPDSSEILDGFVFDGQNHTISGQGQNAILQVYAKNTVIKNVTIRNSWLKADHGIGYGSGIGLYRVTGALLQNVTIRDTHAAGVVVNGSSVTMNNVTTSGNQWAGVNLAASSSDYSFLPNLMLTGSNSFGESAPIYSDFNLTVADTTPEDLFNDPAWTYTNVAPNVYVWTLIP